MSSSSSSLVLLTGATGHLGFRVLLDALAAGYRIRAAVRSEARAQVILSNPVFKAANFPSDQLQFVVVPDLSIPHAYDEAVKGVDYIIHIASPITTGENRTQEEYVKYFIEPAHQGTVGILESAATSSNVKRLVITSSVVAIARFGDLVQGITDRNVVAEDRVPFDEGPYAAEFAAYAASKVKALNEAEDWVKANKPKFDIVHIHPSFIEGRDDLVLDAKNAGAGTNGIILRVAQGVQAEGPAPGVTVHNEDVARLHVESLNPKIPAGSYLAHSNPAGTTNGSNWEDINEIVAKNFPDAVKSGVLPNNGSQKAIPNQFDSTKTEEVFGWKFQDFESQVKSVVGHYLELL
jgi:nucleoside-diphosphate-sugar epimerase